MITRLQQLLRAAVGENETAQGKYQIARLEQQARVADEEIASLEATLRGYEGYEERCTALQQQLDLKEKGAQELMRFHIETSTALCASKAQCTSLQRELGARNAHIIKLECYQAAATAFFAKHNVLEGPVSAVGELQFWRVPADCSAQMADLQEQVWNLRAEIQSKSATSTNQQREREDRVKYERLRIAYENLKEDYRKLQQREAGRASIVNKAVAMLQAVCPVEYNMCAAIARDKYPASGGATADYYILAVFGHQTTTTRQPQPPRPVLRPLPLISREGIAPIPIPLAFVSDAARHSDATSGATENVCTGAGKGTIAMETAVESEQEEYPCNNNSECFT